MDLVSDMLYTHISDSHPAKCVVSQLRPSMQYRVSQLPILSNRSFARNTDRLINRFIDYPLCLRKEARRFDLFHVIDHSYAQLVHHLPPERTVVSCHDLDTFKSVLSPGEEKRSLPFRLMTKTILNGLAKASQILCDSNSVRNQLLSYGVVRPERVTVVLHGTHPTCSRTEDGEADAEAKMLLPISDNGIYLIHVGSTSPRKGIDVLLGVFAEIRRTIPNVRLIRVGGAFTQPQADLAARLGVRAAVTVMPYLSRRMLAAVYRRADLLLLPSKAEGFGLPLVEALACGCPVVASDIPVLREIGGDAATFCPVNDTAEWSRAILALLCERATKPSGWEQRRSLGSAWAARFSWEESAAQCVEIYKQVLERQS